MRRGSRPELSAAGKSAPPFLSGLPSAVSCCACPSRALAVLSRVRASAHQPPSAAMQTSPSTASPDDELELDRVAAGPYCVFEAFNPSLSSHSSCTPPLQPPRNHDANMDNPIMSNEYLVDSNGRAQWFATSSDDMAAASNEFSRGDWSNWMQWDPATSQNPELKPLNVQGPACLRKTEHQRPLTLHRRQIPQLNNPNSIAPSPTALPASAPMPGRSTNAPFAFGDNGELPPAFDFDTATLSSPPGEAQQHNGFYSPPLWQSQQVNDASIFSPPRFEQSAMTHIPPPPLSTPSLRHSPMSLNNARAGSSSAGSSPEPIPNKSKKRKSSDDGEDTESMAGGKGEKHPPVKKTAHNMIEKRYRNNLNDKIAALRDSVPSLRHMSRPGGVADDVDEPEDLEGLTPAHKLNKATVLSKATEYICHLETRNKKLQHEVDTLKGRLESYEKMAISGPMTLHGSTMGTPDGNRYHDDPFATHGLPVSGPPQGMIPVPNDIASLHRGIPPQPHYAPAYPQYSGGSARQPYAGPPQVNGRRQSNAMLGKLMVGSLAGLMILDGIVEHQQAREEAGDRGLFALPINLSAIFAPQVSFGAGSAQIPLVKFLLVFGSIFYLITSSLNFTPKSKKKAALTVQAQERPSLASPVESRRDAWLTAIQTVWVPHHNFLLEVAALGLKSLKLSTRKLIGWQGYALITGITKEQEAARVKAWDIALDAQLTGGDAQISKSRLVLTLMASGTLPDTPARLMLKALHIRVLLWELANAGHGSGWVLNDLSANLARRYWNTARTEQKIVVNTASTAGSEVDTLPEHLAVLLELECDEVLVPSIVQRAYNLAWNRPSAESTTADEIMDRVVGDMAICSPLDALAAWYSSYVLKKSLADSLATKSGLPKDNVDADLELAARTAPPTSQAHARALVAKAILFDNNRAANIIMAFEALPTPAFASPSRDFSIMNLLGDTEPAADIWTTLKLAKCLSLVDSTNFEARQRAVTAVNNLLLVERHMTLLSFVAGYKILSQFIQSPTLRTEASHGLERLASTLRIWVGHESGRRIGLSSKARGRIINHCLDASKTLVGLAEPDEIDDGYVSSSVNGD
ncbi:hypothetical protein BDV95DRAFT_581444 [Massariosphaeria phaeospora]|uniref:BHLH domain-containing protein n=1 Tax=Massariosphaeria phaeospora TaxID=100035 RepID=A0A7C8MI28_9PLEO|nr:hypothetical protein BDV95DRAFT_581444 [Massariosphaeria phaeospora]